MKGIGGVRLALSLIGCFLGAGFVSGQEIWQCFAHSGRQGMLGLAVAWLLGRLEFSAHVGTMYPLFGFIGFLFIAGTVCNGFLNYRKKPLGAGGSHDTN